MPIIVGGEHVTGDPRYALESTPEADIVVLGEGEETLVQLVSIIDDHISWKDVAGIAFRSDAGEVVVNPLRPGIKNLDVLPRPDWEAVPIEAYLSRGLGSWFFRRQDNAHSCIAEVVLFGAHSVPI